MLRQVDYGATEPESTVGAGNEIVLSIGEFSKATGLTVKTLRFYHEQGVLAPTHIDPESGYRYYSPSKIETARVITELRKLDFPLAEIADVLRQFDDEADILDVLERHQQIVQARTRVYREIDRALNAIIAKEREAREVARCAARQVEEKTLDPTLVAGIRMQGKYSDCGRGFARIARRFGRHIAGKPLLLHYDSEYKEVDADFECCMPIRRGVSADGINVRELPGGRFVTLLHKGPYDELGRSYTRVFDYVGARRYEVASPTREIYIKGPGMIFRGNPGRYLTEIQLLVPDRGS